MFKKILIANRGSIAKRHELFLGKSARAYRLPATAAETASAAVEQNCTQEITDFLSARHALLRSRFRPQG